MLPITDNTIRNKQLLQLHLFFLLFFFYLKKQTIHILNFVRQIRYCDTSIPYCHSDVIECLEDFHGSWVIVIVQVYTFTKLRYHLLYTILIVGLFFR